MTQLQVLDWIMTSIWCGLTPNHETLELHHQLIYRKPEAYVKALVLL